MIRFAARAVAVMVLLLDYAAFDDITTGTERDVTLEWMFVALSIPLLLLLARSARARRPDGR